MTSIRTYEGEIRVCRTCAQPAYKGLTEYGESWMHFQEQWDGIYCSYFPLAGPVVEVDLDGPQASRQQLQAGYPDTSQSAFR